MSKKKKRREEQPEVKIAGEKATEESIAERNRIALAYMGLAKDKTFQKMPESEKMDLIKNVIRVGDEIAAWVVSEYGSNDPRKIAARLGVKVFGVDRGKARGAEYNQGKKEIVVYRDFHEKLLREVKSEELSEHLLKLIVAHELFHHLELSRVGEIYKRYKFNTWQVGPFSGKKYIKGVSDAAADAFTQSLLGLEISPPVFDYLTYILYANH